MTPNERIKYLAPIAEIYEQYKGKPRFATAECIRRNVPVNLYKDFKRNADDLARWKRERDSRDSES